MSSGRCPCGSGDTLEACCARYLGGGAAAPTAQALMRSRYTAFAVGDVDYLLATWHSDTRPEALHLDPDRRWLHLSVEATRLGGLFDEVGTVDFTAVYRDQSGRGELREHSRFVREHGRWSYLDGNHPT